jgi:hypothetical protein
MALTVRPELIILLRMIFSPCGLYPLKRYYSFYRRRIIPYQLVA